MTESNALALKRKSFSWYAVTRCPPHIRISSHLVHARSATRVLLCAALALAQGAAAAANDASHACFEFQQLVARHRLFADDASELQFVYVLLGKDGQELRCDEAAARAYPLRANGTEATWTCKFCSLRVQWSQARMKICLCGAPAPMEEKRAEKLMNRKRAAMVQGMPMSANRMFELNRRTLRHKSRRAGSYAVGDEPAWSADDDDVDLDATDTCSQSAPPSLRWCGPTRRTGVKGQRRTVADKTWLVPAEYNTQENCFYVA